MRKFGYLEKNPSTSEALYHEDAIIEALKNVQKFGAIPQTGKLDNETMKVCALPAKNRKGIYFDEIIDCFSSSLPLRDVGYPILLAKNHPNR